MRTLNKMFLNVSALSLISTQAFAASGQQSFTPVSVKVPIYSVSMSDVIATGTGQVNSYASSYNFAGKTDADCLLDLADETQMNTMAASAAAAEIASGTYGVGAASMCPAGPGAAGASNVTPIHAMYVKGTATIGSTVYYTTTPAKGVVTTAVAD